MAKKLKFKVKLLEAEDSSAAGIQAPFNVQELFATRARVPVCCTINGFPFRSSLAPLGGCHMMAVNRTMREGAGVKAGDAVTVVMERDDAERIVEIPPCSRRNWRSTRLRPRTGRSSLPPTRKK